MKNSRAMRRKKAMAAQKAAAAFFMRWVCTRQKCRRKALAAGRLCMFCENRGKQKGFSRAGVFFAARV